jgi:hypothetical protein
MDTLMPSAGTYKINLQINGIPLDECSFLGSNDSIRPFFEESVANDPDIAELVMFLRTSGNSIIGWRVIYRVEEEIEIDINIDIDDDSDNNAGELSNGIVADDDAIIITRQDQLPVNYRNGDELVILVQSLDDLPFFPIPNNLPMGRYTLVSQIMSVRDVLQRTERTIYYLGNTEFSFNGISIHLPGIAESTQVIPRGTVIMLEANTLFDSSLDPYIVWYNGRRRITEGHFSDGMGNIFWKVPEESGFFSISAEIFPVNYSSGLTGFQREISLLVSSKPVDFHLVTEDCAELLHWYVFEGNLNDAKMPASAERAIRRTINAPEWRPVNGTYGIVTGLNYTLSLPVISIPEIETERNWELLFRFLPTSEGRVLTALFGQSGDAQMYLSMENQNLVLNLSAGSDTVLQTFNLMTFAGIDDASPDMDIWMWENTFLTASINFSVLPGSLSAQLYVYGGYSDIEAGSELISIELLSDIEDEFRIILGNNPDSSAASGNGISNRREAVIIWDEIALYSRPDNLQLTVAAVEPEPPADGNPPVFHN